MPGAGDGELELQYRRLKRALNVGFLLPFILLGVDLFFTPRVDIPLPRWVLVAWLFLGLAWAIRERRRLRGLEKSSNAKSV